MRIDFKKIGFNEVLLKITSFNAIAVILQILGGLITSKLIAIYLGERGMALMGYMRNFLASTQAVGSLGFGNGIIKYVATLKEDRPSLQRLLSAGVLLSIFATLATSVALIVGTAYWDTLVFGSEASYAFVFVYLGIALPFITLNGIAISIINGLSQYKKVVVINIIVNLIGLGLTVFLIITTGIKGALTALVITPAIAFLITAFFIVKYSAKLPSIGWKYIQFSNIKQLGSYTIMAVFSMMVLPAVYIAIRHKIEVVEGLSNAGYWDAMTRISDYYLRFITAILTLYILPQLAKATTDKAFRKEIFDFYKTILPLFAIGLVLIYLLRHVIIRLIFTEDFLIMEGIFKWQLLGDLFKVASIVIGYQIIAKNMLKLFLITEIISLLVIYFTGMYFVQQYGFKGAAIGHCVSYFVHLCMLLFIFRQALFGKLKEASE